MKKLKELWKKQTKTIGSPVQKASATAPLMAYQSIGQPIWTPRRYDCLSEEGYKRNVIVYRAVNLISRGVASVPWRLYQDHHELVTHPLLDLLHAPNPLQAGAAFMENVASYLLLSGNSYIEAMRLGDGGIGELYALRPDRVRVIPGRSGTPQAY